MIRSKVKEKYRSMATSLVVVLAATLAILLAADIPVVSAEDAIFSSDAGTIYPYPDNYDIGIGEGENLLFAGNWENMPRGGWSEEGSLFLVESDVPVILNRITSGTSARVSWGVPGGVSIVVKKSCNYNNNDTSIFEEIDDDVVNIIPIVSTAMVDVNGQSIAKVSIVADFEDEILPEDEEISLAESRMADISPNFLPSSEFSLDYKCWSSFGEPCEPKKDNVVEAAAAAETSEDTSDLSSNEKSMDGSETYDASSDSSITDVTDESKTSSTSSASMQKTIATTLLLGLVTTVSIVGTAGSIAFGGGRKVVCAVTTVFIFATIFMAILPPPTQSLTSFGSKRSSSATTKSTTTTTRSLNDNQPHQCVINVEIVYWGCNHQVYIDAPDVSLRNSLDDSYDNWDTCQCQAKHLFPWNPVLPADSWGESPESFDSIGQVEIIDDITGESSMVYHVKGGDQLSGDCMLAVGRPYRDNTGSILSASICDANNDLEEDKLGNDSSKTKKQNPWSKPSLSFLANASKEDNSTKDNHQQRLRDNSKDNQKELHKLIWEKHRQRIGKKWANQALGEHASIASFAAFTLALMSNGAPPNLIRDSLTAAQDELRHAKVSFEIAASLLSNSDTSNTFVEPTALPPSNLQFGANLTELALGTSREGCIEETLSAIEMAVEYDEFIATSVGSDDSVTTQLRPTMETIKTIALEEGNHSVLAWRTIEWICSSSKEACKAVQEQVLDPTKLHIAGEKRFPEIPQARQIWNCIWTSLLTVTIGVAGNAMKENTNLFQSLCAFDDSADATLSEKLANRIISQLKPDAVESTL